MRRRASSPAASEPELDIFDSLQPGQEDGVSGVRAEAQDVDFDNLLNDAQAAGDDGDEAFIALQQAASYRKASNLKGRTVKKGGGFQAMGLNANLLKAIARKGFSVPTPIQRKTIPLLLDRKDVVGMARTGSGKTGAFVIPMIERLRAHSARFGSRALIMSPSRELAIQTLKVVKEFSRGTDLRVVLLVGGDSLEEQFSSMASNPDIVIATPGRFLHLKVEMSLDLSSIEYVVFDEADRLFEMGFAAQLTEILHALPPSRQTLLFSATLPASLVEFARAGLQDPSLIRLDAETKVSPDLECAFFSVKGAEKEGSLLHILHDVIQMPLGTPLLPKNEESKKSKKRKRGPDDGRSGGGAGRPTEHSTIVFTATKHHVEYLANVLQSAGFAVSHVYGSLDQTARRNQVDDFRNGRTNILVVTDVAARGIDIPILANVINYDFPSQPKIFVHRVGRTARAGQRGWSYSLVRDTDAPYLLDLQLFLGRRLVVGQEGDEPSFASDVVVGALKRDMMESHVEWMNKLLRDDVDINALRGVAAKAERLYLKTRNSASSQSAKRAREIVSSAGWSQLHRLFGNDADGMEQARADMLARISGFKPSETIFEVSHTDKSHAEAAEMMKQLRKKITPKNRQQPQSTAHEEKASNYDIDMGIPSKKSETLAALSDSGSDASMEQEHPPLGDAVDEDDDDDDDDDDDELQVTVSNTSNKKSKTDDWRDSEVFMSYTPRTTNAAEERGYGVHSGGFVEAARHVTMDFTNDETAKSFGQPTLSGLSSSSSRPKMRWDARSKKYVARGNDEDGSKGAKSKLIVGESGVKIAATFQSGRYAKWKRDQRTRGLPRVGETERPGNSQDGMTMTTGGGGGGGGGAGGTRYKHKQEKAPKAADKFRDDYEIRKKRVAEAKEKRIGRFKDGMGSKKELKGALDIRRAREEKERRKAKNARPVRRKK